jgi:hypothetical protein
VRGIRAKLGIGRQSISRPLGWQEQFLIAWVGAEDTVGTGLIDLSAVDPAGSFWNDVVETRCPGEPAYANDRSFWQVGQIETRKYRATPHDRSGVETETRGEVRFEPDVHHAPTWRRSGSGV